MIMKRRTVLQLSTFFLVLLSGAIAALPSAKADESKDTQALLEALGKSKLTLLDGVRQAAKGSGTPISAKFELEDGKLSLSVYTAGKGLSVEPEKNVLQELSGSPEADKWAPNVEVFKDVPHVARSSEQLTLMALGKASLADIIARVQEKQSGTVFSVTPIIRNHKSVAEVLVADQGKVKKLIQPL
jgi:hypothetical protein